MLGEWQLPVAFVWGGLMALERKAVLQAMFSRPIVASTGAGLLLGDVQAGLFIGMVLELFYLGSASLGAVAPEQETVVATGATSAAAVLSSQLGSPSTPAIWSLCILSFLWLGFFGRGLDRFLERFAHRAAEKAAQAVERGELKRAVRQNIWAMWPHFWVFGLVTAACALAAELAAPYIAELPLRIVRGLAWAYPAIGSVAAAMAVRGARARHGAALGAASAAAVMAAAAVWSWLGRTA